MKLGLMATPRSLLAIVVCGVAAACTSAWGAGPAPAAKPAVSSLPALQQRLDQLVRQGYDEPDLALAALEPLLQQADGDAAAIRSVRLAQGLVQAREGREAAAEASARALSAMGVQRLDEMARADSELVRAVLAETGGRLDVAADHAQAAMATYDRLCAPPTGEPREDCDYRARWRTYHVLAVRAGGQGIVVAQRQQLQAAAELAHQAGDDYREAFSLLQLASSQSHAGETEVASRALAQAWQLARSLGSPELQARARLVESIAAERKGDSAAALRGAEEALRLAQEARSPRLQALVLTNLSDDYVKAGRPREALDAVQQALPVVQRHHEVRWEQTLLHNAGLARLGLHQVAGAKKDFERMLTLWQARGEGVQAEVMREFGDALAAAGDIPGALELYHRERKLSADIMSRNRESALRELQTRYDREAKERSIELLERDNALKGARIENRTLLQRLWTLLAVTLALAALFAVLLYLRVRETQRQLERSHARLRVQSERDALTGLANRRHFQDVMRQRGAHQEFSGALLLIDIDHFKRVNDEHGHATGDDVLVEVAQRLNQAVREDDLVVRWGGEEFLVFAPRLDAQMLPAFAERLLKALAGAPMPSGQLRLPITASIGHGHFPLDPGRLSLGWERAVNLVDMALYTAKSLGRNRAVGIGQVMAKADPDLRAVEQDFERAWTEGRVRLEVTEGPAVA